MRRTSSFLSQTTGTRSKSLCSNSCVTVQLLRKSVFPGTVSEYLQATTEKQFGNSKSCRIKNPYHRSRMAWRLILFYFLLAILNLFDCPGRCESQPQQFGKGVDSSGSTQFYQIWSKSSGQEQLPREFFPRKSCNHSDENVTCPGLLDYLDHFCARGGGADNLTAAELEKGTVVLHLMPGVHYINATQSLTCRHNLVIEGSGGLNATILETGEDPAEKWQNHAALEFANCNAVQINGITFRSGGAGTFKYFIESHNTRRFEVLGCVFESLGPGLGALRIFANSAATSTSVIDCQFQIEAAQVIYPFDWSKSSVFVSLTTTPKTNKDNAYDLAFSHMTVLRSSFVLHVPNVSCGHMRNAHRTWTL